MGCHVLTNPKHFVEYAKNNNITYEYLIEAFECIGQQATARMFSGSSSRGSIDSKSAATIMNWMKTFEFIHNNPNHIDNDQQQPKSIQKIGTDWDDFVELIKKPIPETEIEYWKTLSNKKLSEQAIVHGMRLGVKNNKAIKNLLDRMIQMVERRKQNIWNQQTVIHEITSNTLKDYKYMNIFELKQICKERNICSYRKIKTDIINLLEKYDKNELVIEDSPNYKKFTLIELKELATTRGFHNINKLNRNALIKLHFEFDNTKINNNNITIPDIQDESIQIKIGLLELNNKTYEFMIDSNGMVNATSLCRMYNKRFNNYYRNKDTKLFIEEFMSRYNIKNESEIIQIRQGGRPELQGSWVVSKIAVDIARWIHPSFAVQIAEWIDKLIFEGFVVINKPIFERLSDENYDNEAITLEKEANILEHTNCIALYVAYIGKGLVKIGSSDSRLCLREEKHTGCESEYDQFRILKVFEISSRTMEHTVHKFLDKYRYPFNKQKEIFRPNTRLIEFIGTVEKILLDNDLKLQLDKQIHINNELKIRLLEAENTILKLQASKEI
jgi:hypothetical protein